MSPDDLDGRAVVDTHWPYDGPHTPDTVREAAAAMAELVRYLNNATGPGNSTATVGYAPQLYRLLGNLTATVGGLDQQFEQLAAAAERHAADPLLYDDRGLTQGARPTVELVAHEVGMARDEANQLRLRLSRAHQLASHLGHDLED